MFIQDLDDAALEGVVGGAMAVTGGDCSDGGGDFGGTWTAPAPAPSGGSTAGGWTDPGNYGDGGGGGGGDGGDGGGSSGGSSG